MQRKGWIAVAVILLTGIGAAAGTQVEKSCYISADGVASWSHRLGRLIRLDFDECDPFTGSASQRKIGTLEIVASFEGRGLGPDSLTLTIKPDGSAILRRGLDDALLKSMVLSRSDYAWFYDRLAPLRDYVDTNVVDRPMSQIFRDPTRKRIWCDTSSSLHPNGVIIIWGAPRQPSRETPHSIVSSFDLGCQGPAGDALRSRLEPVVDRLFQLENAVDRQSTDT